MKVYEASGYQYKRTPSIVLKGQWLSELGFDIGEHHDGMVNCVDLLRANAAKGGNKKEHCDKMIQEAITLIDEMV